MNANPTCGEALVRLLEAYGVDTVFGVPGVHTLELYRGLAGRIRRARYLANMSPERWAEAVREHEQILAALQVRDGPVLARLLKAHLANTFQTVKECLAAHRDA